MIRREHLRLRCSEGQGSTTLQVLGLEAGTHKPLLKLVGYRVLTDD